MMLQNKCVKYINDLTICETVSHYYKMLFHHSYSNKNVWFIVQFHFITDFADDTFFSSIPSFSTLANRSWLAYLIAPKLKRRVIGWQMSDDIMKEKVSIWHKMCYWENVSMKLKLSFGVWSSNMKYELIHKLFSQYISHSLFMWFHSFINITSVTMVHPLASMNIWSQSIL